MRRAMIERWLTRHPESIHTAPRALLDRCQAEVREHAQQLAWSRARTLAEESLHHFDHGFGLPASEAFVTREVCHEVARELKRREPRLQDEELHESEWLSRSTLETLDPEARDVLREWIGELAQREEHLAWKEIVSFTHHLARELVRDAEMTNTLEWNFEKSYPRLAERVAAMLLGEFDGHLRPDRVHPDRAGADSAGDH